MPGPRPGNFIRGVSSSIGEGALASDVSGTGSSPVQWLPVLVNFSLNSLRLQGV